MSIGAAYGLWSSVENAHQLVNEYVDTDKLGYNAAKRVGEAAAHLFYAHSNKKQKITHVGVPQIKSNMGKIASGSGVSVVNQLAGRASMTKKNKSALKKIKKKKTVKVPKVLRKQIKQVLVGSKVRGGYTKSYHGFVGTAWITTGTLPTKSLCNGAYGGSYLLIAPSNYNTNNYTHWAAPIKVNGVYDPNNYLTGSEFVYFTPSKFLDAASVLWNKKTPSMDYSNPTGNFTTQYNTTTGVAAPGGVSQTKLQIINSYVSFELKNCSQRPLIISIKNCVPKIKYATKLPLNSFVDSIAQEIQNGGPLVPSNTEEYSNPLLPFKGVKGFSNEFTYEEMKIMIKPGETCKHSIQGPRNYELDYGKLTDGTGSNKSDYLFTKTSVACVISVIPDLTFSTNIDSTGPTEAAGRFIPIANANPGNDKVNHPVAIEVVEHFELALPEQAGFIQQAVTAGNAKELDLRSRKRCYYNGASANPTRVAGIAMTGVEEENATNTISGSRYY